MLTVYRRHRRNCPHRSAGRKYRRCRCPIWADGTLAGQQVRKSVGLRDWEKAQALIRDWEAQGSAAAEPEPQLEPLTIGQACEEYLRDARARHLAEKTVYKYRLLFRQLEEFAGAKGLRFPSALDLAMLREFRARWRDGNLAALKKLERLRSFCRFAVQNKWIAENPAAELKSPKVIARPTLPFTHEEMIRILEACDRYQDSYGRTGQTNARRLRAFVLLLRYSGMRISDVVRSSRDRLVGNKLQLYTQKTGVLVYCPLPDFVNRELGTIPHSSDHYFFWTGESKLPSATGDWQAKLKKLFRLANVPDGHAHRFRDTFAVELLLAGVPLERVSVLLGHTSIKVTERHYAPWVRERQEQAEADVRRAWGQDPVALLAMKGTPEVHETPGVVN